MALAVYILCLLTALGCAGVLFVAWRRARSSLLFWSGACFFGLGVNEAVLIVDLYVFPEVNLLVLRRIVACVSIAAMLFALILQPRAAR